MIVLNTKTSTTEKISTADIQNVNNNTKNCKKFKYIYLQRVYIYLKAHLYISTITSCYTTNGTF